MFDIKNFGITGSGILDEHLNINGVVKEDEELNHLIMEAIIYDAVNESFDDEMSEIADDSDVQILESYDLLSEKSIVRLDKKAKLKRSTELAVYAIAKENNDKNFGKLVTLWKMEKILIEKLRKKYLSKATQRAKRLEKEAKSKSRSKLSKALSKKKKKK